VWVAAGALDGDVDLRVDAHVFVRSKAPWWPIDD
jgi:hypothetical protein